VGSFVTEQRDAQTRFFEANFAGQTGYGGSGYRLHHAHRHLNLAPFIREVAPAYFDRPDGAIMWHRHANHALSSQVCCLNFLMPLATRPDLLARVIGETLAIPEPKMLPIEEGPGGEAWYVGFEWIGRRDYLSEAGEGRARTRGANTTSADAIVRFEHAGQVETLLIEWKYTESYGAPIPPSGNKTRTGRYASLAFAPNGPLRADLGLELKDFFYEPFYQLLRQQILAWRMQEGREDGAERVRVLHIAPAANRALHRVTSPALLRFGDDAFEVFSGLLQSPADFISCTTQRLFGPSLQAASGIDRDWAGYLLGRYTFMLP
jgi:hypothetical protein